MQLQDDDGPAALIDESHDNVWGLRRSVQDTRAIV